MEPVKPIRICASKNEYFGVDGLLIVGDCPECGQGHLNNLDNKFCGGCGRPIDWTEVTERMKKSFGME